MADNDYVFAETEPAVQRCSVCGERYCVTQDDIGLCVFCDMEDMEQALEDRERES